MKRKTIKKSRNRRVKNYRKISRKKVKTRDRHRTTHGIPMRKRMKKRTRHRDYRGGVPPVANEAVAAANEAVAAANEAFDASTVLHEEYLLKYPMFNIGPKKLINKFISKFKELVSKGTKRYFVLYNDKIEYYENKKTFKTSGNPIKTLFIKDIETIIIDGWEGYLFFTNNDVLIIRFEIGSNSSFIEMVELIRFLPDNLLGLNFAILLEVLYRFNILNEDTLKSAITNYELDNDESLKKDYIKMFQQDKSYYTDIFVINNYITLFIKHIWRDEWEKKDIATREQLVKEIETHYNEISTEDKISNEDIISTMEQKANELVENPNNMKYKAPIYVATYILSLETQLNIDNLVKE